MNNNTQTTRAWKSGLILAKEFASVGLVVTDGGGGFDLANVENDQVTMGAGGNNATGTKMGAGSYLTTWISKPNDMDDRFPFYFRIHWTCDSANLADHADWSVLYKSANYNTAFPTINATLDVAIADDLNLGSGFVQRTEPGFIAAGKLTGNALFVSAVMDALPANATDTLFLGLEYLYASKSGVGGATGVQIEDLPTDWT